MSKRKLSTYQLPTVPDEQDRINICVPVPNDTGHIRAFLGQIDALSYWWTWDRDELKLGTVAARQWLEIARQVREQFDIGGGCNQLEFRQNPQDSCQLQYRNSPDAPWSLAFDFGLCTPPTDDLILQAVTNNNSILARVAGDVTNININAPILTFRYQDDTTPAENGNRNGALCFAVRIFVQLAKQAIEQEVAGTTTALNLVNAAGTAVLGLATAVTGGVALPLAAAIWAGTFAIGSSIIGGNAAVVLADPIAEEDVRCLMYDRLKNAETNVLSFQESLRPGSLTGNSEVLRQSLYALMNTRTDEMFRAFVNILANADNSQTDGECLCPSTCEQWDFVYGGADLERIDPTITNAPGGILGQRTALGYQSVTDQRAGQNFTSLVFALYFPEPLTLQSVSWQSSAQTAVNGGERVVIQFFDENMTYIGETGQVSPQFPALNTIYDRAINFAIPPANVSAIKYVANGGTNSQTQRFTVHNFEVCPI